MKFHKKKLFLVICLAFTFISLTLTGCGSSSKSSSEGTTVSVPPPSAETKIFEDIKQGIKFNYPANWEVKSDKKMIASYTSKASKEKDLYSFNIIAVDSKETIDWSTYGKQAEKDLMKQLKEGKILSNTNVKVAGFDGIRIEYTSKVYDVKMKSFSLTFGKDKKLYVVTAGGSESAYDMNASAMDNLVKSLTLN